MSRTMERRLAKLETAMVPAPLVNIMLVAEDDPDAERLVEEHRLALIEKHGTADFPFPTVIYLVGATKEDAQ